MSRTLDTLRRFVREQAVRHGMSDDAAALVVTAVNEAATYLRRSARGDLTVRMWAEFGALVCDLRGTGSLPDDPSLGFRPPELMSTPEDGLWLVRQLCHHVEVRSADDGCALRVHLPGGHDEELLSRTVR